MENQRLARHCDARRVRSDRRAETDPSAAQRHCFPHIRDRSGDRSSTQYERGAGQDVFKAMGNENASTFGQNHRHPFMHRTETIDYAVVLEGEIVMLLDDQDVHLKAGDVVVQRGTNHAWSNRSDKPCKMLYVLIDGEFDEELEAKLDREHS
jgi:oxalate decarboxylase/phosphoglucose isomerase-like protein (cupin superfamily)